MPVVPNPSAAKPSLYEDFEISIEPRSADGKFPVHAEWRGHGRIAQASMVFPIDDPKWQNWLNVWQNAPSRSDESLRHIRLAGELPLNSSIQDLGQNLFAALFVGKVRDLYRLVQDNVQQTGKRLRLRLRINAPELAVLPWEFLYDDDYDHDYIALTHTATLVRTVDTTLPVQTLAAKSRLRILGMAAAPNNLPPLNIQKERELVENALHDLRTPVDAAVDLIWVKGQTWSDLERDLRANWHVFHFIGHGAFDKKQGSIALVGQNGQSSLLSADALARELKRLNSVRLVVLNSCEGALTIFSPV